MGRAGGGSRVPSLEPAHPPGSVNFQGGLAEMETGFLMELLDFCFNLLENFRDEEYDGLDSRK